MVEVTEGTDYFIKASTPNAGIVELVIRCTETVDAADTIAITLNKWGIGPTGFIGVIAFVETTLNSVYAQELVTTSVTAGVLTLTIPAGTDNDKRFIIVYGQSINP
jgi:hypothetical protein